MIGIVGGVGPYAGLDLQQKILEETRATADQDHLGIISWSEPEKIPDRTAFLLGQDPINPADPIVKQLLKLEQAGATVAGIPCNTAHAPRIYDQITAGLNRAGSSIRLLHMIQEVGAYLQQRLPNLNRIGVLSTTGTLRSKVYPLSLEPLGFSVLTPGMALQESHIHPAIYDPDYGIKANGISTERARSDLLAGANTLEDAGAQAIVLGCTEIPLAIKEPRMGDMIFVDPARILARALINALDTRKLK